MEAKFELQLYKELGLQVKNRRKELHLTQEHLADRVGLTRTAITNIEAGKQSITLHAYFSLCAALNVSPTILVSQLENQPASFVEMQIQQMLKDSKNQETLLQLIRG